ncbi:MAG: DUF262 domain-containing protein [Spirochaetaceae bacterium]|jgi:uncharacterized protein with ParB-like and HNH nuclease domain|nr:DUF262 domain-containing protein [Spirochaetaceae bacterium]
MNRLEDKSITISEALQHIKSGEYVMPAFQRNFVWSMEKIEKLWDYILCGYPIATFLFWHVDTNNVKDNTCFCEFLRDVKFKSRKEPIDENYSLKNLNPETTDTAILDGQQRLTSLFISLYGTTGIQAKNEKGKTAGRSITSLLIELDEIEAKKPNKDESMKYGIKFTTKRRSSTQFDIKDILNDKYQNKKTREAAIEEFISHVSSDKEYARNILRTLYNKIFEEKLVRYTDSFGMDQEMALEMFVRFNSAGKSLTKVEITMSILEVHWPEARIKFKQLLDGPYKGFKNDFIIRAAFMVHDYVSVRSDTFNRKLVNNLKDNWNKFEQALTNLKELFEEMEMKIEIERFKSSWTVLLPIIYSIYHDPDYKNNIKAIQKYLLRAIFFKFFLSNTRVKLERIRKYIDKNEYKITVEMLNKIDGLSVTDGRIDDVLNYEKSDKFANEVFHYLSLDLLDTTSEYKLANLHPENSLKKDHRPHLVDEESWKDWCNNCNKLPNLYLVEGSRKRSNSSNKELIDYYNEMNKAQQIEFKKNAMIPDQVSLEIEKFGKFYEVRKALLADKIRELLG